YFQVWVGLFGSGRADFRKCDRSTPESVIEATLQGLFEVPQQAVRAQPEPSAAAFVLINSSLCGECGMPRYGSHRSKLSCRAIPAQRIREDALRRPQGKF